MVHVNRCYGKYVACFYKIGLMDQFAAFDWCISHLPEVHYVSQKYSP